jgi:hypothetical protein
VGQVDPRVKAVVAWDNFNDVSTSSGVRPCTSAPKTRPDKTPITKPTLGMSADYSLVPTPYTAEPGPTGKSGASLAASKAAVDTGELVIRGGTHYEFSYIPNPGFGGTRRGMDMVAWYTLAWMDKEVKGDPSADARLLTTRWRDDKLEKEVDAQTPADGNMFSTYLLSRLDIGRSGGTRFICEDMRKGCPGMAPDGEAPNYSFLKTTQSPDLAPAAEPGVTPTPTPTPAPDNGSQPAGSTDTPPAASGSEAVQTINQAGGCRPKSRITRIRRIRGVYRFTGRATPSAICHSPIVDVRLIIKRSGHRTRRVATRGTTRFRVSIRLKPGGYAIQARARALDNSVEAAKRGHRFRVR